MPRDMSNNAGNQQNKNVQLNLDALGDVANDSVNFGSNEKPELPGEVEATIVGVDFYRRNELQTNQNDPAKKYFKCILAIETEFEFDGKTVRSRDNYSGLRYIPQLDEFSQVARDANGEPVLARLWLGETSKFGKLFLKAQEFDSSIKSYSDFLNFINTQKKCVIKTEHTNYGGKDYVGEVIQRFI